MPGSLCLLWDYDSAIGQINATLPYKFRQENIIQEIENVDYILKLGSDYGINMTFACVGFTAEPGHYPYHVPEQIKHIHELGHEVASHSWRHEWFPFLEKEQIRRSLARSKETLENCLGVPGSVKGFVPPFNRPMTWYRKVAISLGDRALGPWYHGSNIGSLLKILREVGYTWCRLTYRSLWSRVADKFKQQQITLKDWQRVNEILVVPHHYCGFDEPALQLLDMAAEKEKSLVITGHPTGLNRRWGENVKHFQAFLQRISDYQEKGKIKTRTISEYMVFSEIGDGN
jgi:peptidoglycan/xylan/chitin deacetylase (PgdA/CDA1 family)